MPLDPELAALLDFLSAAGTPPMSEQTPADARAGFRTLTVDLRDPSLLPPMAQVEDSTVPGPAGDIPIRVYRPEADGPLPTVAFFHGGGWVIGDLDTHDLTCRTLAEQSAAVVVSVDYRLAPEHPFPAAVEDARAAATWIADHLADLGGTQMLGVAGDSAGGNLAAVLAQEFRDRVGAQLLIYPATDVPGEYASRVANAEGYFLDAKTMLWFLEQYAGTVTDPTDPALSPLYGELDGAPPAVVVVAGFDPLRDEGLAYAAALEAAGVAVTVRRFDSLIHGFVDMGRHSKAAQDAVTQTFALFSDLLHR
ncbi:alpha/beta hydrolase [Nocardioides sp. BP30]|uniref:alpha/beta hydrolase n=1 Tax=Nocardioides sp. BP30 TaxID=3036374 RepID=UPI002468A6A9|nr:alpha/beta hydrolase [Nocardioides sp. BP30]WGL53237.1 alpha/beta hydrolase [Nocardioides sp. BP30]